MVAILSMRSAVLEKALTRRRGSPPKAEAIDEQTAEEDSAANYGHQQENKDKAGVFSRSYFLRPLERINLRSAINCIF